MNWKRTTQTITTASNRVTITVNQVRVDEKDNVEVVTWVVVGEEVIIEVEVEEGEEVEAGGEVEDVVEPVGVGLAAD